MLRVAWSEVALVAGLSAAGAILGKRHSPFLIAAAAGAGYAALDHFVFQPRQARASVGTVADQLAGGLIPL